jgi:hypothetical protein
VPVLVDLDLSLHGGNEDEDRPMIFG